MAYMDRGNMTRHLMDCGGMHQGPVDRDGLARGPRDLGLIGRSPMDGDGRAWSPFGREGVARGPLGRDGVAPGPLDREGATQSRLDRDAITEGMDRDGMRMEDGLQGTIDGDNGTQSNKNQNDGGAKNQSDMEQSDMEQCDMEQSDTEQSDEEQSDGDEEQGDGDEEQGSGDEEQGDLNQSSANQGEVNVSQDDPTTDNAKKSDNPEDTREKFFCEVCRLTCLSFMSFQSHNRGAKHLRAARAAEGNHRPGMYRTLKLKNAGKTLKNYMDEPLREPLIGLEHVLEYRAPRKVEPSYLCELCNFKTDLAPMIEHLNGFKHRKAYISKEYPFLLKAPPGSKEDKVQFLRRMAADIERDEGLKMYRVDPLTKKKNIKSLLEIKPDEIAIKRSRCDLPDPNKEALKTKALQHLETYEIDSDAEAVLIMTITQELTDNLKTYCLQVKEEKAHAEKVARSVAKTLARAKPAMQPASKEYFGDVPYPSGPGNLNMLSNQQTPFVVENTNWPLDPIRHIQPGQFPAGGPNWSPQTMQNQPALGRAAMMQNPLPQKADWSHDPLMQVRQVLKAAKAQGPPASFARSDPFGPKGIGSELRPFPPNEPRGSGGFPSGIRGFGNEYGPTDSGALPSSMPGGPSPFLAQANSLHIDNPIPPGIRLVGVPRGEPVEKFIRGLQNQGTPYNPISSGGFLSGTPANFSAGPKIMPVNINAEGRIGNVGYSNFQPPSAPLNVAHVPLGPSAAMELPKAMEPEKPEKKASPLTAEILNRLRGKDVKSASVILTSLAASNPALQKVNIANLLNLLVQTGTIK